LYETFHTTTTYSYLDAPPLVMSDSTTLLDATPARMSVNEDHPLLVFSGGALGAVSQNTGLMEELASHGYAGVSITHPGGTAGVQYPNGDIVTYAEDFRMAVLQGGVPDPDGKNSPNITNRFLAAQTRLEENLFMGPYLPRWRDDGLAVVDYLMTVTPEMDPVLGHLVDGEPKVIYMGQSFGGSVVGSAAQAGKQL
jgi:hypothetical protein